MNNGLLVEVGQGQSPIFQVKVTPTQLVLTHLPEFLLLASRVKRFEIVIDSAEDVALKEKASFQIRHPKPIKPIPEVVESGLGRRRIAWY